MRTRTYACTHILTFFNLPFLSYCYSGCTQRRRANTATEATLSQEKEQGTFYVVFFVFFVLFCFCFCCCVSIRVFMCVSASSTPAHDPYHIPLNRMSPQKAKQRKRSEESMFRDSLSPSLRRNLSAYSAYFLSLIYQVRTVQSLPLVVFNFALFVFSCFCITTICLLLRQNLPVFRILSLAHLSGAFSRCFNYIALFLRFVVVPTHVAYSTYFLSLIRQIRQVVLIVLSCFFLPFFRDSPSLSLTMCFVFRYLWLCFSSCTLWTNRLLLWWLPLPDSSNPKASLSPVDDANITWELSFFLCLFRLLFCVPLSQYSFSHSCSLSFVTNYSRSLMLSVAPVRLALLCCR